MTMISRRDFLRTSSGALAPAVLFAAPASNVKLACQTNAWAINPQDFNSLLTVLHKLKELGYAGFETGFRNVQGQFERAADARKQLAATGLQFFGSHIFLEQYDPQTQIAPLSLVQKVADGIAQLGAQRLILSGGGVVKDGKLDAEALQRKVAGLHAAGKHCRALGLRLAYHNHGPEFAQAGLEIEALYRQTDPALVDFLTDCGWAFRAKMNVPEFFAKHQRRMIGLHLRDFKGDEQVPLGQGDFPVRELAAAIQRAKWTGWVLNEEERLSGEKPGEKAVAPARQMMKQVFDK